MTAYAHPPIVEALIAMTFDRPLENQAAARLAGQLGFSRERSGGEGGTVIERPDGSRAVSLSGATLRLHVFAPYPGWAVFREDAQQAVRVATEGLNDLHVRELTVRYVDRIRLPKADIPFSDYFTWMPPQPRAMPSKLDAFQYAIEATDAADRTRCSLTIATAMGDPPVVLYDLMLSRPLDSLASHSDWLGVVDQLHQRQKDLFEDSVTNLTRELFR